MKPIVIVVAAVLAVFALLMVAANTLAREQCFRTWAGSGYAVRYGALEDCRVEVEPGRWVPAGIVRETRHAP